MLHEVTRCYMRLQKASERASCDSLCTSRLAQRQEKLRFRLWRSLVYSFPGICDNTADKKQDSQCNKCNTQCYWQSFEKITSKSYGKNSFTEISYNLSNKFSGRFINRYHDLTQLYHGINALSRKGWERLLRFARNDTEHDGGYKMLHEVTRCYMRLRRLSVLMLVAGRADQYYEAKYYQDAQEYYSDKTLHRKNPPLSIDNYGYDEQYKCQQSRQEFHHSWQ